MAIFRKRWVVWALMAALVIGWNLARSFAPVSPLALAVVGAAVLLAALVLIVADWQFRDEAFKAAQKDAWLWGSMIGVILTIGLLKIARGARASGYAIDIPAADPLAYVLFGAIAVLMVQGVAFFGVWSYWWLSKR